MYEFISYLVYRKEQSKISMEKIGRKYGQRKTYQKSNY